MPRTKAKGAAKPPAVLTEREASDARFAALAAVAGKSKAFRPARDVLRRVRAVRTCFAQIDRCLGVGGFPIDRVATVHGPSGLGKTQFGIGLGLSFLLRGHFFKMLDVERTTPPAWVEMMARSIGLPNVFDHPGFSAMKPDSFEDAVDEVRDFCTTIGDAKAKNVLPADTTAIILVDSLRKLVPKKFFEKIARQDAGEAGVDGFGGRGAQIKAALNAAWLDELVPLLDSTGTLLVFIARESEDVNADANDKKYGRDFKITGGKAVIFDSSLVMRVERGAWVVGAGDKPPVYGEKHRVTVSKTKIAGKDDRTVRGFFHSSNGTFTPEGFDVARDVVTLGAEMGVVAQSGGWLSYGKRRWNGENQAVKWFTANPDALRDLEEKLREKFDTDGSLPATPTPTPSEDVLNNEPKEKKA